jgi:hypothetical protein
MLQGIEKSELASLQTSVDKRDKGVFEQAYKQMINACFGCHQLAEKPYLRPHIPETPSSRMIDFRPAVQ